MRSKVLVLGLMIAGCEPGRLEQCDLEYQRCERVVDRACEVDDRFCKGPANARYRTPLALVCSDNYAECLTEDRREGVREGQ